MITSRSELSLSARLSEFVVKTVDLPDGAIEMARKSLTDAVAVSIAASSLSPAARPFRNIARRTSSGRSVVIGFGNRVSAPMAAFANGALAHGIDYEDTHDNAIAHPHAAAVASALAIVDDLDRPVTGLELLRAIALSGDLVCRLASGYTTSPDTHGWHTTPWLGVFGASTAAGLLLRLGSSQMVSAWSLAMSQMASFGELKNTPDSDIRSVRDAFAAHAGLMGALLAAEGVKGFDQPLEGQAGFFETVARGSYRSENILSELGGRFLGSEVSFKPWPSCRGTHAYIQCALELSARPDFSIENIDDIEVVVNIKNRMLCEPVEARRVPQNAIGAKFSIPFTLATALVKRHVDIASFMDASLRDPLIRAVAAKVRHRVDETIPLRETTRGTVTVMQGADRLTASVEKALGHPNIPLSGAVFKKKFEDCLAYSDMSYSARKVEGLWGTLSAIRDCADVRVLTALLSKEE